jgi:hypothetical protein
VSDPPSGPTGNVGQPSVESARETAFKALARQAVDGGFTLGEYAERAVAIQQAATTDEIDAIQKAAAAGAPAARRPGWLISVLARVERRGQWRLRDQLRVVSVFTVQTLDLGTAQLQAPESAITIITAFGGASVIAPQGVSLDISGFALFGGRNDNRAELPPFPGSPVIRIRAFSIFGGVGVEDRVPQHNLLDAIRAGSHPAGSPAP